MLCYVMLCYVISCSVGFWVSCIDTSVILVIGPISRGIGIQGGGKSGHGPPIEIGNGVWPPLEGRKSNDSTVNLLKSKAGDLAYGFGSPLQKETIIKPEKDR